MEKHVPPSLLGTAFNCPHCGAYSTMDWGFTNSYVKNVQERTRLWVVRGHCCRRDSFWWIDQFETSTPIKGYMIFPSATHAPLAHDDMPEAIRADYEEASNIVSKSSRGACALLRLSVQKLCEELGYTSGNINKDIGKMVEDGLPVQIQQALDVVRVVGNNAVHPGELSKEDVDGIAMAIFYLINEIIEDRIAKPKRIAELYKKLPTGALDAIQRRDA